jgi:glucosamine--fructose-6-phosphate aminotransferase (isomerizing)
MPADPTPGHHPSLMALEAAEAPQAVARLLATDAERCAALGEQLRRRPAAGVLTLARGSSDHAAQHLAYLVMARMGRLVTSLPPSLLTLYEAPLPAAQLVALAFSQSGRSPDLVEPMQRLRAGGATTVAFVNDAGSPLAAAAEHTLPLHAGAERSVAATKSFIAQLVAGVRLLAAWQGDAALAAAVQALPAALAQAAAQDFSAGIEQLAAARQLYVIGRGPGLAVAQELALKFKETCGLQAEAFSGAELVHGPLALVQPGWPLLVLAPRGPAQAGLVALAQQQRARGAAVLLVAPPGTPGAEGLRLLPAVATAHADLDAIALVQSLYPMVEALSRALGRDPDQPPGLQKVTLTR